MSTTGYNTWDKTKDKECSDGYKTVWVISSVHTVHLGYVNYCNSSVLYWIANGNNFTSLTFYRSNPFVVKLQYVKLINGASTSAMTTGFANFFRNCVSLRGYEGIDFSNATSLHYAFYSCYLLKTFQKNVT